MMRTSSVLSVPFKSVAVVGGGFAGLGAAYHACKYAKEITVYDLQPSPGIAGASAISVLCLQS